MNNLRSGFDDMRALLARFGVAWVASLAIGLFAYAMAATEITTNPQVNERKSVLIVVGVQYGLPVSDAMVAGAVAVLKDKGVSTNDIFVEYLDLVRADNPPRRAALVSLLRQKLAQRNIGLVIAQNQEALNFLAQDGADLMPPGVPVLSTLVATQAVAWRGAPHRVLNVSNQFDTVGTLRQGLALFPRTRRLVLVAGADSLQATFHGLAAEALATLRSSAELEDTVALSYEDMLQRIATLPPDTLVLLGTYFKDRTGRSFTPADVAVEVGKLANAPVLGLYDIHIGSGLIGGSVVSAAAVGRRAGDIGFDLLSGARLPDADNASITVPPQALFDWTPLQRWRADPGKLPPDTVFVERIPQRRHCCVVGIVCLVSFDDCTCCAESPSPAGRAGAA